MLQEQKALIFSNVHIMFFKYVMDLIVFMSEVNMKSFLFESDVITFRIKTEHLLWKISWFG